MFLKNTSAVSAGCVIKGTDLFVDTMIAILPQMPGWSAIIAGRATGPHVEFENGLKEKVRAAGLADRILFVGEHTDINRWYQALDLFIAPSAGKVSV